MVEGGSHIRQPAVACRPQGRAWCRPGPSPQRRGLAAVVLVSLGACAPATMLMGPVVEPKGMRVPMDSVGPLPPIKMTLQACAAVGVELQFQASAFASEAELERLVGGAARRGDQLVNPGQPITLRVTMRRVERAWFQPDRLIDFQTWEHTTRGLDGRGAGYVYREAGFVTVPRGEYQVEVGLAEAVPAFKEVPATVSLGSSFKFAPNKAKC